MEGRKKQRRHSDVCTPTHFGKFASLLRSVKVAAVSMSSSSCRSSFILADCNRLLMMKHWKEEKPWARPLCHGPYLFSCMEHCKVYLNLWPHTGLAQSYNRQRRSMYEWASVPVWIFVASRLGKGLNLKFSNLPWTLSKSLLSLLVFNQWTWRIRSCFYDLTHTYHLRICPQNMQRAPW